jgi:hypothetical protein
MNPQLTGREPYLSGVPLAPESTGHEPSLGGERGLKQARDHVLTLLDKPNTSHLRRAAIGDWLATTGDTRPGVGLRADGLPDLLWCPVSGGDVMLRDSASAVHVERFYIAQYPVTWAQYRIFLEAEDGHEHPYWWDGLRHRPEYERHDTPVDNQPAQEVSWYDAVAYTRWLSSKLEHEIRLPSEWEWQQAASGGDPDLLYPWGQERGQFTANTRESLLRRATAVGMYPKGESPVGALDMSGTVLEWCTNEFADPDRVQIGGAARRVARGGSWFLIASYARTIARTGHDPYLRFNSVGLRLAADSLTPRPLPEPPPPNVSAIIPSTEPVASEDSSEIEAEPDLLLPDEESE